MSTTNLLVTGVNGDIGRCVVTTALAQGKKVYATVRNEKHFSTFPEHKNLTLLLMHVDDTESVKSTFKQLDELLAGEPLNAIIHCAAIAMPSTIETLDHEWLLKAFKVNTLGSLSVMQQSFPRLRKSGGNLVLASSLWGRVSGPMVGPYSSTKWALESLTEAARRETMGMGFNIVLANIGAVKSKMVDSHAEETYKLLENASDAEKELYAHVYKAHADQTVQFNKFATKLQKVANRLLEISTISKPSPRYKIGSDAKVLTFLSWLLPASWLDKIMGISKK